MNNTFVGEYVTVYERTRDGGRLAIAMGRIRAVVHDQYNGLQLWIELEDADCVGIAESGRAARCLPPEGMRVGDTYCVFAHGEYGWAYIHIHKNMTRTT